MNEWERGNDRQYAPGYAPGYPQEVELGLPKKKKWLAGLLAFFVPGLGHFYLGQMAKGIAIMMLIAFDICAIVFAATQIQEPLVIVLLSLLLPIIYFYSLFDAVQSTDLINQRRRYPGWAAQTYVPRHEYMAPHSPGAPSAPAYGEPPAEPSAAYSAAPADAAGRPNDIPPPMPSGPMPESAQGPFGLPRQVNATGVMALAAIVIVLILVTGMGWSGWVFHSSGSMAGAVVLIAAGVGLWIWEMRGDRGRKR